MEKLLKGIVLFFNPFGVEFSQKMPFLPRLISFFGCSDSKLALMFTKKRFPSLKVDFPEIRRKNV